MIRRKAKTRSEESEHSETCSDESRTEGGLDKDKHNLRRQKTDLEISASQHNHEDGSRVECQICLSDFQVGDKICWSNNPQCVHAFHIDCLEPWLMKHNHCPLCRNDYLVPPSLDAKVHEGETTNHTRDVLHAENSVTIRGILGDIILPLFQHSQSTHSSALNSQLEGNSTQPSLALTDNGVDEAPVQLETNTESPPVDAHDNDDMDCFDLESGESIQLAQ